MSAKRCALELGEVRNRSDGRNDVGGKPRWGQIWCALLSAAASLMKVPHCFRLPTRDSVGSLLWVDCIFVGLRLQFSMLIVSRFSVLVIRIPLRRSPTP